MLARLRRIVFGRVGRVVAGLACAWLLFAWFGFGPLVRWAVPQYVVGHTGRLLEIDRARLDPFRLAIEIDGLKLSEPDASPLLSFAKLRVDFEASSLFRRAYVFREIRLESPVVALSLHPDGGVNWVEFVDAFGAGDEPRDRSGETPAAATAPPRLRVEQLAISDGRVDFADDRYAKGFRTHFDSLEFEVRDLSTLPDDKGRTSLQLHTTGGAALKWSGTIGLNPLLATGDVSIDGLELERVWPYLEDALNTAPPSGRVAMDFSYRFGFAQRQPSLQVEALAVRASGLELRGGGDRAPSVGIDALSLAGGHVDLQAREAGFESLDVAGGHLALTRAADGRIDLQDWFAAKPAAGAAEAPAPLPASTPAAAGADWHLAIGRVALDQVSVRYLDQGFAAPLAVDVGRVGLGFAARASFGAAGPDVAVDDLGIALDGIRIGVGGLERPPLTVEHLALEGGRFDLADRNLSVARVSLEGGRISAAREAGGRVAIAEALRPVAPAAAAAGSPAPRWRYRIDRIEGKGFELGLRDDSVLPAASLGIEGLRFELNGLSDDSSRALPAKLSFGVGGGGRFEASGNVVPGAASADLHVAIDGLALKAAQPYLSKFARVELSDGTLATAGRLQYRDGTYRYEGGADIRRLLLKQTVDGERLLAWSSLSTQRLTATPERLDIGTLRLDGLDGKLVIFKDRTVNVGRVLVPRAPGPASPASGGAAAVSAPGAAPPAYRVGIDRVELRDGSLDFADLSLALPFGTRIHGLAGSLVGLSNEPGRAARLELDGKVDDYGLARARGQIDLFDPTALTDARVEFRNVEMTRLTPYSATFAGRAIRSGKLSLDLEYKIRDHALAGDNRIVMDRLTLGEKVDSPQATNLPLDLAIAVLQDSDGRIELGLPVSGSLDDPKFSFGAIVGKAIVNVITKIATAPFRALAALLGGGNTDVSRVVFDPGGAALLPPEREKLEKLAAALARRPRLTLAVKPGFDPQADGLAIRDRQLRSALAAKAGRPPAPGGAPGPVALDDPATKAALEAMFVARFDAARLDALRARFAPKSGRADDSNRLYQAVYDGLRDAQQVGDELLRQLAMRRGEAVRDAMRARGVAPERISLVAPSAEAASEGGIPSTLELGALSAPPDAGAPGSSTDQQHPAE